MYSAQFTTINTNNIVIDYKTYHLNSLWNLSSKTIVFQLDAKMIIPDQNDNPESEFKKKISMK